MPGGFGEHEPAFVPQVAGEGPLALLGCLMLGEQADEPGRQRDGPAACSGFDVIEDPGRHAVAGGTSGHGRCSPVGTVVDSYACVSDLYEIKRRLRRRRRRLSRRPSSPAWPARSRPPRAAWRPCSRGSVRPGRGWFKPALTSRRGFPGWLLLQDSTRVYTESVWPPSWGSSHEGLGPDASLVTAAGPRGWQGRRPLCPDGWDEGEWPQIGLLFSCHPEIFASGVPRMGIDPDVERPICLKRGLAVVRGGGGWYEVALDGNLPAGGRCCWRRAESSRRGGGGSGPQQQRH